MSNAATLRAQISDLTSEIPRQQQLLEARLRDLQKQLDSTTYPVLTLPLEITSEIFLHCLPTKRASDVMNVQEAPLLLTHVCRAWREVAISTPALWTTFDIDVSYYLPCWSEIAETWFKRTRRCALFVKICGCLT
ncbi:hypothetical protein B0H19DRAFT_1147508 [Mycena capillaripes]|nr:hypothetical protein B0H19DRAFT_1147508 [Mycena capillaripes]